MRRPLQVVAVCLVIAVATSLLLLLLFRDRLILDQVRQKTAALSSPKISIGSLHTELFGQPGLILRELEILQDNGGSAKLKEIKISSPLSLYGLYSAVRARSELPLIITVSGLRVVQAPERKDATESAPAAWPKSIALPALFPMPVNAELMLEGGELQGAASLKGISAKLHLRGNETGFEAAGNLQFLLSPGGAQAQIPVTLEAKLAGSSTAVKLLKFSLRAAGLEANGSGDLSLQPVSGKLIVNAEAPDLARLNLRAEDRSSLGLTGPATGSLTLKMAVVAGPEGAIAANGMAKLQSASFPLKIPEKTIWSSIAEGVKIEGPVWINAELPFRALFQWPFGSKAPKISIEKAELSADLTHAALTKQGLLEKPRGVTLRADFSGSSTADQITADSLALVFHSAQLKGAGKLAAPFGSTVAGTFHANIASLSGFPALLPVLRQGEAGAALTDAQGSLSASGRVLMPTATPSQSFVELRTLSLKNIRLPLAYENATVAAKGVLLAAVNGQGTYEAGALNVAHSAGSFDLTDLNLTLKDKFTKKRGRKLTFVFDAKGSPAKLQIAKMNLVADGLNTTVSGSVAFPAKGKTDLQLFTQTKAQLAPLAEYLPKLPAKVSGGALDAQLRIGGSWLMDGGIEKSPLSITGKINGKIASVTLPEAQPSAKAAPAPPPVIPSWPVIRNTRLEARMEIAQLTRGALQASGILFHGDFNQGKFFANAQVAKTFGGKASLRQLAGSLLDPKLALRGSASLDGIDLSQAAAFVDPTYKDIVRGSLKADSSFELPSLWSESMLETMAAQGQATVKKGYLSTASFDGLVNEKLSKIPGLGSKANVKTGGMEAEIRSRFRLAQGIAHLEEMVATTPKQDEMRLAGTLAMNFDANLTGEAHLSSAPVSGPIREANSDPQGRLVVPVRFFGNLKNPQVDIATDAIQAMLSRTAVQEGNKLKAKAVDTAKGKIEEEAKKAMGGLFDGLLKKKK